MRFDEAEVAELQMKKFNSLSGVLGKTGLVLSLLLPTIGLAADSTFYGPGTALQNSGSPYSPEQLAQFQKLRGAQEAAHCLLPREQFLLGLLTAV